MTVGPLPRKERPTARDTYEAVIQVHDCLHQMEATQDADRETGRARDEALLETLVAIDVRLGRVEGFQTAIGHQIGVVRAPEHQDPAVAETEAVKLHAPLGLWRASRAFWAFALAGAAGAGAYKIIWEVGVAAVKALHHAMLSIA